MIVVADLEPEQLYYITVAGSTSIGLGLPSEIITSAPLNQTHGTYYAHDCTMFIQLLPFRLCLQKSCSYPAGTQNIQEAHTSTALIVAVVVSVVSLIGVCVIAICVVVVVLLACKRKANRKITSPKNTKTKKLDDDNYELFNAVNGHCHVYEIVGNKNRVSMKMKKKDPDSYSNDSNIYM